jgi:hypothetical protein
MQKLKKQTSDMKAEFEQNKKKLENVIKENCAQLEKVEMEKLQQEENNSESQRQLKMKVVALEEQCKEVGQ